MNDTLSLARYYRDAGLSVIPVRPRDKVAAVPWAEYQRRLPTGEELGHWWPGGSENNIGVVCGDVSGGFIALDFDNALNLRNFLDANPDLEQATVIVKTARGGHLWLQTPEPVRPLRIEEFGLDVKGEGSYVVAPPSIHPSGKSYEFANDATQILTIRHFRTWLEERLAYLGIPWHPENQRAAQLWREVVTQGASEGTRNVDLASLAGRLRKALPMDEGLAVLSAVNAVQCSPPLGKHEVEDIAISIWRYGGPESVTVPFCATSYGDLVNGDVPAIDWLVDGILPAGGQGILGGDAGVGKTWLLLSMALSVAAGMPWLDTYSTKQGRVLFIDEEGSEALLRRRLHRLRLGLGLDADLPLDFLIGAGVNLSDPSSIDRLRPLLADTQPILVFIDSLIRVHRANENDAAMMAGVMSELKALGREFGCAFILTHHARKISAISNAASQMLRGTTDLRAFVDSHLFTRRKKAGGIVIQHEKSRFAEPVHAFEVELTDDGDATVLRYLGEVEGDSASKQERAEELIIGLLAEDGELTRQDILRRAKDAGLGEHAVDGALASLLKEERIKRRTGARNAYFYSLADGD